MPAPRTAAKWRAANTAARVAAASRTLSLADRTLNIVDRIVDRVVPGRGDALAVLTYHRVAPLDERPDLDPSLISATPAEFGRQLDYLGRYVTFVGGAQVLAACRGEGRLPTNAVLITFDDAYLDFATHAWPQLRQRAIPVVLFVPTHFANEPEEPFWWDALHRVLQAATATGIYASAVQTEPLIATAPETKKRLKRWLKSLPPAAAVNWVRAQAEAMQLPPAPRASLNWHELRKLANEGVEMCAHTRTHPIMTQLDSEGVRAELGESHADLCRELGGAQPLFAYPSGVVDDRVSALCADSTLELAFTTRFGAARLRGGDPFRLGRINVSNKAVPATLRAMLTAARLVKGE